MDINQVITKEEFDKNKSDGISLDYETLSIYLTKLVKLCVEESLKALPSVMTHLSSQASYLKGLSDKFYKDNKDLNPHRKIMAQSIESIEGENPGKGYDEILKLAAVKSRDTISKLNQIPDVKKSATKNDIELKKSDTFLGKL